MEADSQGSTTWTSATFAKEGWSLGRGALLLPLACTLLMVKAVYISVT